MAVRHNLQFSFAAGILDPEMAARGDVQVYFSGARELDNVTIDPRGAAQLRDGSIFRFEWADAASGCRLLEFVFEPAIQVYLLAFTHQRLRVVRENVVVADLVAPWIGSRLADLNFTQSFDTLIVTHRDVQPYRVQRRGSHSAWVIEAAPLTRIWDARFRRTFPAVAITPAATTGSGITLTAAGTWFRTNDIGSRIEGNGGAATIVGFVSASELTIDITDDFDDTSTMPASSWLFDQTDVTMAPIGSIDPDATTGAVVTMTASANIFRPHHVGGTISGNSGVASITAVVAPNEVEVEVSTPFASTAAILEGDWTLGNIDVTEPAWSHRRGWPIACTFHEGRLYYAGTRDMPNRVFGSRVGEPFDFRETIDAFDDDPVSAELSSGILARVVGVHSGDGLHILTGDGVFSIRDRPITPSNFVPQRQVTEPAAPVPPLSMEAAMIYVQRAGDGRGITIQEVVFDEARQAFGANDLTALSARVLADPIQLALRRGNASDTATHLIVVNADGSGAVLNSRRNQDLAAWSRWTTDGDILQVAVVAGQVYWLVRRTVEGTARYYLEELDPSVTTDSAVSQVADPASDTWTGFDHLEGETLHLFGDGNWLGQAVVSDSEIVTPHPVLALEAGLPRAWRVSPMPVLQTRKGEAIGMPHRILRAVVRVENCPLLTVNGRPVTFRRFGPDVLDQPIQRFSGEARVQLLGWAGGSRGERATVTIEGDAPFASAIQSITLEVAS